MFSLSNCLLRALNFERPGGYLHFGARFIKNVLFENRDKIMTQTALCGK